MLIRARLALCNEHIFLAGYPAFFDSLYTIHWFMFYYNVYSNLCLPYCPLECHKSFFKTSRSQNKIPLDYFVKYQSAFNISSHVRNDMNYSAYQLNTFAEFYATYDTFSNIEVTEEPKMIGEDLLG